MKLNEPVKPNSNPLIDDVKHDYYLQDLKNAYITNDLMGKS